MADLSTQINTASDLKKAASTLQECLTANEVKKCLQKNKDVSLDDDKIAKMLLLVQFSKAVLEGFEDDQKIELDAPTQDQKIDSDKDSKETKTSQKDTLKEDTPPSISETIPVASNETTQINEVLKKVPIVVRRIEEELGQDFDGINKWNAELDDLGKTAMKRLLEITEYDSKAKQNFDDFAVKMADLIDNNEKVTKKSVGNLQNHFYFMIQEFADFDHVQQDIITKLTKFLGSYDYMRNYFFNMFELLHQLKRAVMSSGELEKITDT